MDRRTFIGTVVGNLVTAPIADSVKAATSAGASRSAARRSASTLAPGFARNIGTYASGLPGSTAITDYSGIKYDPIGNRMCFFGGGHGPSQETDIRVLDMQTLEWSSLYPSTPRSDMTAANGDSDYGRWKSTNQPYARHTYNMTGVFERRFYMFAWYGQPDHLPGPLPPYGGRVCWYDFDARRWSYSRYASSETPWDYYAAAVLDPVSKHFLIAGYAREASPGFIWIYDPTTDDHFKGPAFPPEVGYAHALVYFPPDDRFYALQSDGRVWKIALDRRNLALSTIVAVNVGGSPPPRSARCAFAFDSVNRRIGGNISEGIYYAFDPATQLWSTRAIRVESGSTGIPDQVFHCLAFDPASGCFACLSPSGTATTWIYRPAVT